MSPVAVLALSLFFQTQFSQQIIVTASKVPETVESTPASVSVITKKEIDKQAARDVADVLREVPGLDVSRTGSFGKETSVFMRGASSKQTLVLWNGVEINDPYFSGYNWGQFSTAGVERVEVVRGPFSSLYGADAVGGVVNIITTGAAPHTDFDFAAGGRGLYNGVASYGTANFNIVAEHRQDNGFALNDNDRQNSLLGSATFAPSPSLQIGVAGRGANYDLGVPQNVNDLGTAYVVTPHHRENGNEWQLAIPITATLGAIHTDFRVSQSHRRDDNEDPDSQTFGTTVSSRRDAHLSASASTPIGTLVGGAEVERSDAQNNDSFGDNVDRHDRNSQSLFAEDRLSRGALELSAGVRYDHYDTFGSQTSPRIAGAWMRGGNKFRAAYGQSFRAPQVGELYLPFFGNPNLRPERSRSVEVGYDRFFNRDAVVSVTAFHSTFRDLIDYDLAANRFGNIGEAKSNGVEVAVMDRFGPFSATLTYTYLQAIDASTDEQLPRRPRNSGSLVLDYERGPAIANLVVDRVGSRPDVEDLAPFGTVINQAYTLVDLALHWRMARVEPYAKLENLTNARYQEVFGFPSPSRRLIAGVRYSR
ncbi:MAG TPA: TonB-dependent receptor [Thermoanaerobaculia bacterium]|nr:TonB-dependent receptor [Thermoanaerobaculia bacterium]